MSSPIILNIETSHPSKTSSRERVGSSPSGGTISLEQVTDSLGNLYHECNAIVHKDLLS
eukprot:UN17586